MAERGLAERTLKSVPPARAEAPDVREKPSIVQAQATSGKPASGDEKAARLDRRRRMRWGLFGLLPVALIIGIYWYVTGGQIMSTDDAYVDAQQVGVSTDVPGIVQDVDVKDNEHVAEGQLLYRLGPRPYQIALDNAEANLA